MEEILERKATPIEEEDEGTDRRAALKMAGVGLAGLAALQATRPIRAIASVGEAGAGTPRYAMVIDLRRCIGCRGCTVACKSEFQDAIGVFRSCVQQKDKGTYPAKRRFLPVLCNHCADPPCVDACPVDPVQRSYKGVAFEGKATYQRPDGVVLMDESICIGCGLCKEACPYGARFFHPFRKAGAAPENNTISKCTYCDHRMDQGVVPSCVNTCLGKARIFGDLNDPTSAVSKLLKANRTEVLLPKYAWTDEGGKPHVGTDPHTFYIAFEEGVYQRYRQGIEEEGFHDEIK